MKAGRACARNEEALTFNRQGPAGTPGIAGRPGADGPPGATGQTGPAGVAGTAGQAGATGAAGTTNATGAAGSAVVLRAKNTGVVTNCAYFGSSYTCDVPRDNQNWAQAANETDQVFVRATVGAFPLGGSCTYNTGCGPSQGTAYVQLLDNWQVVTSIGFGSGPSQPSAAPLVETGSAVAHTLSARYTDNCNERPLPGHFGHGDRRSAAVIRGTA